MGAADGQHRSLLTAMQPVGGVPFALHVHCRNGDPSALVQASGGWGSVPSHRGQQSGGGGNSAAGAASSSSVPAGGGGVALGVSGSAQATRSTSATIERMPHHTPRAAGLFT